MVGPIWVVLTCGCGDEAEVDVCVQGRTRCFNRDPMWGAQGGWILETWWRRCGGVEWSLARGAVRPLLRLVLLGL